MTDSTATIPAGATSLPLTAIGTNAEGAIVGGVIPTWNGDGIVTLSPQSDGSVLAERIGVAAGDSDVTATFVNTIASPDGSFLTVTAHVSIHVEAAISEPPPPDDIVTDLTIVPGQPS